MPVKITAEDILHCSVHFNTAYLHLVLTTQEHYLRDKVWSVTCNPSEVTCMQCLDSPEFQEFHMLVELGFNGEWIHATDAVREGKIKLDHSA